MKILKICSLNYTEIIRSFYRRYSDLKTLNYEQHKKELIRFSPVHLNRFSTYMQQLGHECDELVVDLQTLQLRWMEDRGRDIPMSGWKLEVLLQQIESYKPDLLYLQDISSIPPSIRRRLKSYYPFLKGVIVYRGFPRFQDGLEDVDMILTGARNLLQEYENRGMCVRWLPHAFEPSILDNIDHWKTPFSNASSEFTFAGYAGLEGHGFDHVERYEFLEKLLQETNLKVWLAEYAIAPIKPLPTDPKILFNRFKNRCSPGLMGLELYQVLRGSKVVFNKHSSAFPNQVENMRLFEATGIGSCLLSDDGANMSDFFERDREIVTYNSYEECVEKLQYLLENESVRRDIAASGHKRTMAEHTWKNRAETLHGYLQERF